MSSCASTGRCGWRCATSRPRSVRVCLALALPKADSAEHVRLLAEIVDEVEAERGMEPGTTRLIAMVETAAAFFHLAEIARAHPRLCALTLGAEDFAISAGILPEAEGLSMPKQMAVFAARAAGIMPLGFIGSIAEFHDLDGFRQTIRRSRRFGFIGASVIHPSQVPILNEEFRAERRERSITPAGCWPPTTRRWPKGWARSPSTAG